MEVLYSFFIILHSLLPSLPPSLPPTLQAQATKFGNFLVTSKYTSSLTDAVHLLTAARALSGNKVSPAPQDKPVTPVVRLQIVDAIGTRHFVLCREVVLVLFSEVIFYRVCILGVSFVGRFVLVLYWRFCCTRRESPNTSFFFFSRSMWSQQPSLCPTRGQSVAPIPTLMSS